MPYKIIAFDFDGTLADSMALFIAAIEAASVQHGFSGLRMDELDTLRGMNSNQFMQHLGIPAWQVPVIASTIRRRMADGISTVRLFPGVAEMLADLKQAGLRIAIVTSSPKTSVKTVLGDESLTLIDDLECGASLFGKHGKLTNIVRRAKVPPKEMLYIGDELRDADAARAVRADFAAVAWGYARPDVLADRSVIPLFETPRQVVERLTAGDTSIADF